MTPWPAPRTALGSTRLPAASAAPNAQALWQRTVPSCSTQRQLTGPSTLPARSAAGTAGHGCLPARAAPGAGCSALGSATPRSRGCCRPAGRDISQIPAPARWKGLRACPAPGTQATQGEAPAGPSPATDQEEVMLPRTPPRGRWGTPSPPLLPAELSSCPRKHWDPPGTLACPVLGWAPLQELGLPCRHWPQPGGTNPSSHLDLLQALPQSTQLRSTSLAGLGPSPALGGSTPSSPERGRAHAPRGCPWRPRHGTRSPRQAQPQPPAQPGPAGAAVGSQGLRISK